MQEETVAKDKYSKTYDNLEFNKLNYKQNRQRAGGRGALGVVEVLSQKEEIRERELMNMNNSVVIVVGRWERAQRGQMVMEIFKLKVILPAYII